MLQEFEIVELRNLLADIRTDEDRLEKAERDFAHAQLCIDQATQRLEKARSRVRELVATSGPEIDLLKRLAAHAEQHGRQYP